MPPPTTTVWSPPVTDLNRRQFFFLTAGLAGTAAVAGCGGSTQAAVGGASAKPVYGGTLVFATDREPVSLDPAVGGDQPQSLIARAFLDSLVHQDVDGTIRPWLVRSWTISPDGLAYTFHLRTDVHFTDGTPFDAAAVRANFAYWLDPRTQSTVDSVYVADYAATRIVDAHTAVVTLKKPNAAFLEVLAQSFLGIQSPKAIARGIDVNGQSPVGTGPFKVASWDHQDKVTLVRNDDYAWAPAAAGHQGKAYAEKIEWRFIAEPATRFGALQSGEVHVIETVPPESFAVAKKSPNLKVLDGKRPGVPTGLSMNTTRAPFDDLRVRKAFRHAADVRSGLKSVFFDAYQPYGGSLSPTTIYYDPSTEDAYPYDPAAANALLDQAGWTGRDSAGYRTKNGVRLRAVFPVYPGVQPADKSLFEQIQATEKQVGLEVVLENVDSGASTARSIAWDYDLSFGYWVTNTADALRYVYSSEFATHDGKSWHSNGSGIRNTRLDAALTQALQTTDPQRRKSLYATAQQIVSDNAVSLPLYVYPAQYGYNTDKADGVSTDPTLRLVDLYDTWVKA